MPSLNSLRRRERIPEVMDQPGIDPGDHAQALAGLRRINALSRCSAGLFAPIQALALSAAPASASVRPEITGSPLAPRTTVVSG